MLLELSDLEVRYGSIRALKGISVSVDEGEIVTLLGANGAGKTTTLHTISGLVRASSGSIRFDGRDIGALLPHEVVALGIGHAPEGRRIFSRMSVLENLEMGAYQHRGSSREEMERVFELFPVLAERARQEGGTLSGGEQQMLSIGRALMSHPRLMLLDEPSMGLAPMFVAKIFQVLRDISERGVTILVVEQNAAQALALAQRGYVLETGSIAMSDRADALLRNPRVRAAYLGEGAA
jgi:branched-chain amino acid transport system ATP-binding protein